MSYASTEAGEQDVVSQLNTLEELKDEIDQLASQARHLEIAPEVERALHLAWYFAEEAHREANGACSAGCGGKRSCQCCALFASLRNRAQSVKRLL